jgi:hypothetical protein
MRPNSVDGINGRLEFWMGSVDGSPFPVTKNNDTLWTFEIADKTKSCDARNRIMVDKKVNSAGVRHACQVV